MDIIWNYTMGCVNVTAAAVFCNVRRVCLRGNIICLTYSVV